MSLNNARTATRSRLKYAVAAFVCAPALCGMSLCEPVRAQDIAAERNVSTVANEQTAAADQSGNPAALTQSGNAAARNREPIRVPALVTPNTSLEGLGTNARPENAVAGRLPPSIALPYGPDRNLGLYLKSKTWTAPVYCHQPNYYEDTMLEYHGHERCPPLQPFISGTRFFTGVLMTPYLSYINPPLRDVGSAGHYRPGSAAPALRQRAPYDPGALRLQLLTTGTAVLAFQP